ncbi:hypothetical protein ACFPRL_24415 [Pseudoclavibacter helvolus]
MRMIANRLESALVSQSTTASAPSPRGRRNVAGRVVSAVAAIMRGSLRGSLRCPPG